MTRVQVRRSKSCTQMSCWRAVARRHRQLAPVGGDAWVHVEPGRRRYRLSGGSRAGSAPRDFRRIGQYAASVVDERPRFRDVEQGGGVGPCRQGGHGDAREYLARRTPHPQRDRIELHREEARGARVDEVAGRDEHRPGTAGEDGPALTRRDRQDLRVELVEPHAPPGPEKQMAIPGKHLRPLVGYLAVGQSGHGHRWATGDRDDPEPRGRHPAEVDAAIRRPGGPGEHASFGNDLGARPRGEVHRPEPRARRDAVADGSTVRGEEGIPGAPRRLRDRLYLKVVERAEKELTAAAGSIGVCDPPAIGEIPGTVAWRGSTASGSSNRTTRAAMSGRRSLVTAPVTKPPIAAPAANSAATLPTRRRHRGPGGDDGISEGVASCTLATNRYPRVGTV